MISSSNKAAILPTPNDDAGNNISLRNETYDASLLSPCIEISGYNIPASLMVPMVNREEEMRYIVQCNPSYFIQIQQQVDEKTFQKFISTIYAPRHKLNDQDWLWRIEKLLLKLSPSLWEQFQAMVDHFPNPATNSSENATPPPSLAKTDSPIMDDISGARPPLLAQLKEQHHGRESCSTATSSTSSFRYLYDDHGFFFDPRIRQSKTWQKDLDIFLQECKLAMKADDYHRFTHWLFISPSKMTDANWESALYESLNYHPILFLKLKDWIDHQIE